MAVNRDTWPNRLEGWVQHHSVEVRTYLVAGVVEERLVLYKAVRCNYKPPLYSWMCCFDDEPYKPGTLVRPRRLEKNSLPCGEGLHVVPNVTEAMRWRPLFGRVMQVLVKPHDCVVPWHTCSYKIRCGELQVLGEVLI